ncbi:MAG: transposase [Methylobacter sp.]
MNGDAFKEYLCWSRLGAHFIKTRRIVICDNLPAHKVADVKELIKARGATIKYNSPGLNPIEQVFKLKALLRQAAERM